MSFQIQAEAEYLVARGYLAKSIAVARKIHAEAFAQEIQNSVNYVDAYYQRRALNRKWRAEENPNYLAREAHVQEVRRQRIKRQFQDVLKGDLTDELNWLLVELSSPTLAMHYVTGKFSDADLKRLGPVVADGDIAAADAALIQFSDGRLTFSAADPQILDVRWPVTLQSPEFASLRDEFTAAREQVVFEIRTIDDKEVEAGQEFNFPIATEDTDEPVSPREFHLADGPAWISIDAMSGVVRGTPPKSVDGRFEVTIRVCDNGDPPLECQAKFGVVVHGDPWLHVKDELRESLYLIHLQLSGPSGDHTWPFATGSAIGGRTLLTSAREALQLASFRDRGYRVLAVNPATGLKTEIRSLRVTREFAAVADAPNDWIFVNLGLLETEQELPKSIPLATREELASLEEGLPVACIGFPHDGSKMTRFDSFEPQAAMGEVYLMSSLTCQDRLVRLVELKGKIPDNVFGSPVLNQRGAIVAVYGESAARDAASVPDLHYAPVLDLESLQAWLRGIDNGQWVTPPMTEAIAPSREPPLDRPKRP